LKHGRKKNTKKGQNERERKEKVMRGRKERKTIEESRKREGGGTILKKYN
jgi:hypothetical protein